MNNKEAIKWMVENEGKVLIGKCVTPFNIMYIEAKYSGGEFLFSVSNSILNPIFLSSICLSDLKNYTFEIKKEIKDPYKEFCTAQEILDSGIELKTDMKCLVSNNLDGKNSNYKRHFCDIDNDYICTFDWGYSSFTSGHGLTTDRKYCKFWKYCKFVR